MERFGWTEQQFLEHDNSLLVGIDHLYEARNDAAKFLKKLKGQK